MMDVEAGWGSVKGMVGGKGSTAEGVYWDWGSGDHQADCLVKGV